MGGPGLLPRAARSRRAAWRDRPRQAERRRIVPGGRPSVRRHRRADPRHSCEAARGARIRPRLDLDLCGWRTGRHSNRRAAGGMMGAPPVPRTFVALGDSFTEGLDDLAEDGGYRGWADRLAERFAAVDSSVQYANLALRGRKVGQIVGEQVPRALDMRPE